MDANLTFRSTIINESSMKLENGSRVAVIGGGPSGSFFSYFVLDLAERVGIDLHVDIYEPRDFSLPAPQGCNMDAGVISETLVQNLATEGINLPDTIVQKAFSSYILHTDLGTQQLETASHEKRIGAIYRGAGPRGGGEIKLQGLDDHLLSLAKHKGANIIHSRVTGVDKSDDYPKVITQREMSEGYDLLVIAAGVNSATLKLFEGGDGQYSPPKTTKTAMREYYLGRETVDKYFGDSLHVFLLNIPNLDFAMIVPKGEYVSVCMLGKDISDRLIQAFLTAPEVISCFPDGWHWNQPVCQCMPRINSRAAERPYSDRIVFIGDSGASRLYKDGIGAAYRTAKAAAACAVFEGVSSNDFQRHYEPFCRKLEADNSYGRIIFLITHIIQRVRFSRKAVLRMVAAENQSQGYPPRMSGMLWDTFTGSSPYLDVLLRSLHPAFLGRFFQSLVTSAIGG